MSKSIRITAAVSLVFATLAWQPARAQTATPAVATDFAASYSLLDLGPPPGVTGPRGGVAFLAGKPDTLLIGGGANGPSGTIYAIDLLRDGEGHITGFDGTSSVFSSAPEIDGGLAFGPGGVLFYTGYNENLLGQIKPGSSAPDKVISLGPLGVDRSVGTLGFVPAGFAGAGEIRLMSYNTSSFYTASLTPDGSGTYDIGNIVKQTTLPGSGPEGLVYVPTGSPLFAGPTVLISEFGRSEVSAYDLDPQGIPLFDSRRTFVSGLSGAEGGAIDPVSGDFIFSTFGTANQVIVVGGFLAPVPEPAHWLMLTLGLAVLGIGLQRRPLRVR